MMKSLFRELRAAPPLNASRENALSGGIWLWLPLGALAITLILRAWDEAVYVWWINDELGPGENLTAALFFISALLAGVMARTLYRARMPIIGGGFILLAVAAFFVCGEEMSWGQHLFQWSTPEWVGELNKQNETNLHNMAERALDQKPRAVMAILALLFGAIVPFLLKKGRLQSLRKLPMIYWLVPSTALIPAALCVFVPRLFDRATVLLGASLPHPFNLSTRHHQELQELMISIFLFLYLLDLVRRVAARRKASESLTAA
ncbi:hypothetical protein [Telmatospirillum sp. J64-1]|uniref:hypothetical protein n=1 Tax=Telmatospirillum sp. J64-1 TaxID=2502183 RepID=UPI00115C499F|nr:hypothetical protein [Telmatospirillum sp. J64-1]